MISERMVGRLVQVKSRQLIVCCHLCLLATYSLSLHPASDLDISQTPVD